MVLTRLAVLLATSLADWTKCLLATGLAVLEEARRQALHKAEVCLATIVAADSTWNVHRDTDNAAKQRRHTTSTSPQNWSEGILKVRMMLLSHAKVTHHEQSWRRQHHGVKRAKPKRFLRTDLGRTAGWIHQVLAGHLNGLIGPSKLDGVHQPLMPCLAVRVRHTHQVGSLRTRGKDQHKYFTSRDEPNWSTCKAIRRLY